MQRIQSLFLIITIIAAILFARVDFIKLSDGISITALADIKGVFTEKGLKSVSAGFSTIPITVLTILITLSSLVSLFLFRMRKAQIRIIILVGAAEVAIGGLLFYGVMKMSVAFNSHYVPSFSLFLLAIMIAATILAYRGVRSDEKLIESLNRLR